MYPGIMHRSLLKKLTTKKLMADTDFPQKQSGSMLAGPGVKPDFISGAVIKN